MLRYNLARNIMYIPFPFPHAQLSAFFTFAMTLAVPLLMDQYTNAIWMGCFTTFLTVTCLVSLHEVARELENPFRNVPNEIPLCTLHAMYNETLVTMFSGYNPDGFWDAEAYQGMLEAMALGKVYQNAREKEEQVEMSTVKDEKESAKDLVAESSLDAGMTKEEKSPESPPRPCVETTIDSVKELEHVLAKQALEIEELVRLLDDDDVGS